MWDWPCYYITWLNKYSRPCTMCLANCTLELLTDLIIEYAISSINVKRKTQTIDVTLQICIDMPAGTDTDTDTLLVLFLM